MGEYLDQYGGLIVELLTGVLLIAIVYSALAAGASAVDERFFNEGSYTANLKSYIDYPHEPRPELSVYHEISLMVGEELDVRDCIKSAFGSSDYEIYCLTEEESKSTSEIRKSLRAGCVNVCGIEKVKNQPGSYELGFYAKANGRLALWKEEHCIVTYYE